MTAIQLDAQHLAQAIARFRLAARDARESLARVEAVLAGFRTP